MKPFLPASRWRLCPFLCSLLLASWFSQAGNAATAAVDVARFDSLSHRCYVEDNEAVLHVFNRVTVLSAAGEEYGRVWVSESKFSKLKSVEVRLIDATGRVMLKRKKGDLTKQCGFGDHGVLYSDYCWYTADLSAPAYPYSVECEYEQELRSLFFVNGVSLQRGIPIRTAVVELSFSSDYPIAYKEYGFDRAPVELTEKKRRTLTWTLTDIPAGESYSYIPPEHVGGMRLELVAERFDLDGHTFHQRSWKNVGLWAKELFDSRYNVGSKPTTSPSPDEALKAAKRIYMDLIRAVRYVAVQIGISGWQPSLASETEAKKYGDCKGMAVLLVSQLRSAGIEAYPCLILTKGEGALDTSFVNLGFNHVIAMALIGRDTLWMDPTCDVCPPGDLPSSDEDNTVLIITDRGGVLVRTPRPVPNDNQIVRTTALEVDDTGFVSIVSKVSVTGNYAHNIRASLRELANDEADEYMHTWLLGDNRMFNLSHYTTSNLTDITVPLIVEARLNSVRPTDRIGQTHYVRPILFSSRDIYGDAKTSGRSIPISLGSPRSIIDSVFIHGTSRFHIDSIVTPVNDSAICQGASASISFTRDSTGATACYVQEFRGGSVPTDRFDEFTQFLALRRKILDTPVKLRSVAR